MLHTWSLSIEIQFYCLSPLIFLVYQLLPKMYKLAYILLLFAASLTLHLWTQSANLAFYFLGCRIWQFLSGTLAYFIVQSSKTTATINIDQCEELINNDTKCEIDDNAFDSLRTLLQRISATYLCLVLTSVFWFPYTTDRKIRQYVVVLCTFCLLSFGANIDRPYSYLLNNRILLFIGDISYSVYLVHWPILLFFKYYTPSSNSAMTITIATISIAFGYCSYRLVEQKLTISVAKRTLLFIIVGYFLNIALILHTLSRSDSDSQLVVLPSYERMTVRWLSRK
jgi:peptidoglycan/LPS O-acetylase OafA/YrhL